MMTMIKKKQVWQLALVSYFGLQVLRLVLRVEQLEKQLKNRAAMIDLLREHLTNVRRRERSTRERATLYCDALRARQIPVPRYPPASDLPASVRPGQHAPRGGAA